MAKQSSGSKAAKQRDQGDALSREFEEVSAGKLAQRDDVESLRDETDTERDELLKRNAITIEPVTEVMRRGRPDEESVVVGFQLVMVGPKGKVYAGRTLRWSPISGDGMHFDSEEQARSAAIGYARTLEAFYDIPNGTLDRVTVELPVVIDPIPAVYGSRLQVKLSVDEVRKLTAIRLALRQLNKELSPEGPVATNNDVIRWILRSIEIP